MRNTEIVALAWGKAKNQDQNKVREAKALWNTKVSLYIADFIEFKKLFNGQASKLSSMRYGIRISDKEVQDFQTVSQKLTQDFQVIISEIRAIVVMQNEYAQKYQESKIPKQSDGELNAIFATKKAWNNQTKEFLNSIIEFKKFINGFPNKFFQEKTRIHEALKANPDNVIGILENYNRSLISYSVKILTNQSLVKVSSEEFAKSLETKYATNDLSALEAKYASNPLSRMWTKMKTVPKTWLWSNDNDVMAKLYSFKTAFVTEIGKLKKQLRNIEANILDERKDERFNGDIYNLDAILKTYDKLMQIYLSLLPQMQSSNQTAFSAYMGSAPPGPELTVDDIDARDSIVPAGTGVPTGNQNSTANPHGIAPLSSASQPSAPQNATQNVSTPVTSSTPTQTPSTSQTGVPAQVAPAVLTPQDQQRLINLRKLVKSIAQEAKSLVTRLRNNDVAYFHAYISTPTLRIDKRLVALTAFSDPSNLSIDECESIIEDHRFLVGMVCHLLGIPGESYYRSHVHHGTNTDALSGLKPYIEQYCDPKTRHPDPPDTNPDKPTKTAQWHNPISDWMGRQVNKLKFWKTDSTIRNHINDVVKEYRLTIDALLDVIQKGDIIDNSTVRLMGRDIGGVDTNDDSSYCKYKSAMYEGKLYDIITELKSLAQALSSSKAKPDEKHNTEHYKRPSKYFDSI